MKDGIKEIIGKRVSSVVIAHDKKSQPRHRIFLVFDNETFYEIYRKLFTCCSGVVRKAIERALEYAKLVPRADFRYWLLSQDVQR